MSITASSLVFVLTLHCSEKHSRKEEALARLKAGENFHDVALIYAEHKRDEGKSCTVVLTAPEY